MEIVPGVHAIDTHRMGRCYLYQEADRLTLIDTGMPGRAGIILGVIEALGRKPSDLGQIVITHWHGDHAGSLADLVERSEAQVLVHALDAPIVRGEREGPGPQGVWRPLAPLFRHFGPKLRGVRTDRELQEGDEIDLDGGARVLHVPGHTQGSIALYLPARRLLFAGDAAANIFGLRPPVGMFTEDMARARDSVRKLAPLDFDVACFGHGTPLTRDASTAFRRLAKKLG